MHLKESYSLEGTFTVKVRVCTRTLLILNAATIQEFKIDLFQGNYYVLYTYFDMKSIFIAF